MKLIVDKKYQLKKMQGKGGWTFAEIPEIALNKTNPFGWQQVYGFIDTYELTNYKLMPMGNGNLFLPVKAAIRKIIKKDEGDWVHIKLFIEETDSIVDEDFETCLKDEPVAFHFFQSLEEDVKRKWINFINAAKSDSKKIERMAVAINALSKKISEPISIINGKI